MVNCVKLTGPNIPNQDKIFAEQKRQKQIVVFSNLSCGWILQTNFIDRLRGFTDGTEIKYAMTVQENSVENNNLSAC